MCVQAVYFYTSEGRAQCFAFEGNNRSRVCVCVCVCLRAYWVVAVWPIESCISLYFEALVNTLFYVAITLLSKYIQHTNTDAGVNID